MKCRTLALLLVGTAIVFAAALLLVDRFTEGGAGNTAGTYGVLAGWMIVSAGIGLKARADTE